MNSSSSVNNLWGTPAFRNIIIEGVNRFEGFYTLLGTWVFEAAVSFLGEVEFSVPPICTVNATEDNELANRGMVLDEIGNGISNYDTDHLAENNAWTGLNSYTQVPTCSVAATTGNQLVNLTKLTSTVASIASNLLASANTWTNTNLFQSVTTHNAGIVVAGDTRIVCDEIVPIAGAPFPTYSAYGGDMRIGIEEYDFIHPRHNYLIDVPQMYDTVVLRTRSINQRAVSGYFPTAPGAYMVNNYVVASQVAARTYNPIFTSIPNMNNWFSSWTNVPFSPNQGVGGGSAIGDYYLSPGGSGDYKGLANGQNDDFFVVMPGYGIIVFAEYFYGITPYEGSPAPIILDYQNNSTSPVCVKALTGHTALSMYLFYLGEKIESNIWYYTYTQNMAPYLNTAPNPWGTLYT